MKVTYTAPNRSHHYPYAEAMDRAGYLHAFVSGFSRLSPRSSLPSLESKLYRHDFFQTLMVICGRAKFPPAVTGRLIKASNQALDRASYKHAVQSDAFIYYRTEGMNTTRRLRKTGSSTFSIMEEVNSHVDFAKSIMYSEYERLGLANEYQPDYDHDLRKEAYNLADYILCPSDFVRSSFIEEGFPENKLLKVPYGFNTFSAQPTINSPTDTVFRVLFVGQINIRKGIRYALEAFERFDHPNKEFVIVGPTTSVTGLEGYSIPNHVKFTGVLKGDKLAFEYSRASVFILPSLEEGWGLVLGEALSFGTPVIATTNSGGPDLIEPGRTGFVVPAGSSEAIYQRFIELADNPDLLSDMGHRAVESSKTLGNWDRTGELLAKELHRITV